MHDGGRLDLCVFLGEAHLEHFVRLVDGVTLAWWRPVVF